TRHSKPGACAIAAKPHKIKPDAPEPPFNQAAFGSKLSDDGHVANNMPRRSLCIYPQKTKPRRQISGWKLSRGAIAWWLKSHLSENVEILPILSLTTLFDPKAMSIVNFDFKWQRPFATYNSERSSSQLPHSLNCCPTANPNYCQLKWSVVAILHVSRACVIIS
ncbi:MAG: hypothetical protein ABIN69_17595, partial [Aestuariivirga sp.]